MEKNNSEAVSSHEHQEVAEHVPTENGAGHISELAEGGDLADMPKGYYTNWRFIGSVAAVSFMAQGLYLGQCSAIFTPIICLTLTG